ncbi:DarT ssDNA thymidine ADP-ribosyltransferase family protein [Halomonas sp. HNIBRBA4712]|uniref:DarT ssDNA thymidine ADP-ribosyltransferase family protein n=1 Tax=Halomonas sp. HNIBRBA4712 TaxID=3373087 RepID=UPI00374513F1
MLAFLVILVILFFVWVYELNSSERYDRGETSYKKSGSPAVDAMPDLERREALLRISRLSQEMQDKESVNSLFVENKPSLEVDDNEKKEVCAVTQIENDSATNSNSCVFDKINEIKDFVSVREIPYLVHFTQAYNIPNIISNGLLTRTALDVSGASYVYNDALRLDGVRESVSLSIGFPNYKMFYKYRCKDPSITWVMLVIDKSVLWENNCLFCKYNAADRRMIYKDKRSLGTVSALKEMYDDLDDASRSLLPLATYDPTNPQAEVLSLDKVSADKISAFIFDSKSAMDQFDFYYPGKNSFVDASFFSSREYSRKRRTA